MLENYAKQADQLLNHSYKPVPDIEDRSFWDQIHPDIKNIYEQYIQQNKDRTWPVLTASRYMDYYNNGNRSRFQKQYFERRLALQAYTLVLAMDPQQEVLENIIDMLWMICEETSWVVPAHNLISGYQDHRTPLPPPKHPIVDLFAAETAAALAICIHLHKKALDEVSPMISQHVCQTINQRILEPYLHHTDFWWMGFMYEEKESLNNWNPWINTNVLLVTLLLEENPHRKVSLFQKIIRSLDQYLIHLPEDGGCDEGPSYWNRAGASAHDCLWMIKQATHGKVDIYGHEKIKEMARFIKHTHIDQNHFINFADAAASIQTYPGLIYQLGKAIDDEEMLHFAKYMFDHQDLSQLYLDINQHYRCIIEMEFHHRLLQHQGTYHPTPSKVYPDTQLFIQQKGPMFFAAKGGHNKENHNHNDVGNFILYDNGQPVFLDTGNMEYTKKTFSPQRYEIWTNQSDHHNVPKINGISQKEGRHYCATDLNFDQENQRFSLDIGKAYPKEAGIQYWKRQFDFDPDHKRVLLMDEFALDKKSDVTWAFMTKVKPLIKENQLIVGGFAMTTPPSCSCSVEQIPLDDEIMLKNYGSVLYRTQIQTNTTNGCFSFEIKKIKEEV